jgi:hypothetical protein
MKKVLFILALFVTTIQVSQAQKQKPTCPPGYTATGAQYNIDKFNFHKPRTDCASGFGICIKGHWTVNCTQTSPTSRITPTNSVDFWYKLTSTNQLELHLPASIASLPEYVNEDTTTFYVEDNSTELKDGAGVTFATLKDGAYTVTTVGSELVIVIDLL